MIYILIVMWAGFSTSSSGKAALAVEFNSIEACRAAAAEIKRQEEDGNKIRTLFCAQKGKP